MPAERERMCFMKAFRRKAGIMHMPKRGAHTIRAYITEWTGWTGLAEALDVGARAVSPSALIRV
jgi:hypothetical protein